MFDGAPAVSLSSQGSRSLGLVVQQSHSRVEFPGCCWPCLEQDQPRLVAGLVQVGLLDVVHNKL